MMNCLRVKMTPFFLQNLCFDGGLDKLELEFRKQLREHSNKPVSPALLQKVVSAESANAVPDLKHIPGDLCISPLHHDETVPDIFLLAVCR